MKADNLFLKKKTKGIKKNLVVNLLELIQVMEKKGYDTDYKVSRIQIFLSKFKQKKKKKKRKEKEKKKKRKIKKIK